MTYKKNLFFLLLFFAVWQCEGQIHHGSGKFNTKGMWIGFSGGTEFVNNSMLNSWLTQNGVKASSKNDASFGVKALIYPKKLVFGVDIGQSIIKYPNQTSYYFDFLLGLPARFNRLNVVPLIGIGNSSTTLRFNDTIPSLLYQTKLTNGKLFKETFYAEAQVMLFKRVGKKFDSFGVTIGCHLYFWQGDWRYIGTNGKVIESSIPNLSTISPFISIHYGFTRWVR
ncbi:MAG: hypothetical protein JSS79_07680 [Bacteroidetes bacterium]|nr:hypothetical protein [Bacteroidota bacterium]